MTQKVFVITGAAGSGKTTVSNYLTRQYGMPKVITHTTRTPRKGEQDGVDYYFETAASFEKKHFLERVHYDKNQYGSSLEGLEHGWQVTDNLTIVLDTKGAVTYHQKLGDQAVIIFLMVSDPEQLQTRLETRGDRQIRVKQRIESPEYNRDLALPKELQGVAHVVVNDDWQKTQQIIDGLVAAEK